MSSYQLRYKLEFIGRTVAYSISSKEGLKIWWGVMGFKNKWKQEQEASECSPFPLSSCCFLHDSMISPCYGLGSPPCQETAADVFHVEHLWLLWFSPSYSVTTWTRLIGLVGSDILPWSNHSVHSAQDGRKITMIMIIHTMLIRNLYGTINRKLNSTQFKHKRTIY